MRAYFAIVLGLAVSSGCHKTVEPELIQDVSAAYAKSPDQLEITFTLTTTEQHHVAAAGTLEVARYATHADADAAGKPQCSGSAAVPEAAFANESATATVALAGCPPIPKDFEGGIRVHFVPADKTIEVRKMKEGGDTFTMWKDWVAVVGPPDPTIAKRKEIADKVVELCPANPAKAAEIRAQVAPAITAAPLPAPTQHLLAAVLAKPNACDRRVSVSVKWTFSGDRSSFATAVETAAWPTKELAKDVGARLDELGGGWLAAELDSTLDTSIELDYDVFWTDQVALGTYGSFPRLRIHRSARFRAPPALDEKLDLGDLAFEPVGQEIKFADGSADEPVVAAMQHQLVRELGQLAVVSPP